MKYPFVSVIIPCRNEGNFIKRSLESILNTDYPKDRIEVLVIDGKSDDGTLKLLQEISRENFNVKILSNPKKITPTAMNIGIQRAKGDVIIRVDAHSEFPSDYICKCVKILSEKDAWCVGGPFYTASSRNTLISKIIAYVLSCGFGVGASLFRTKKTPMYVDTVPFGAFKKDIFDKIGLYDERLTRNQDNELCDRIIRHGGKIFMSPEIKNIYYPKSTLREFLAHARNSGMWNAFTNKLLPYTFKWRHFIPLFFFIGVIFCLTLMVIGVYQHGVGLVLQAAAPILLYCLLAAAYSYKICLTESLNFLAIPLIMAVFFLYHFNYGYGIFKGWFLVITRKWKNIVPQIQN